MWCLGISKTNKGTQFVGRFLIPKKQTKREPATKNDEGRKAAIVFQCTTCCVQLFLGVTWQHVLIRTVGADPHTYSLPRPIIKCWKGTLAGIQSFNENRG
jgi:hypothetical protein